MYIPAIAQSHCTLLFILHYRAWQSEEPATHKLLFNCPFHCITVSPCSYATVFLCPCIAVPLPLPVPYVMPAHALLLLSMATPPFVQAIFHGKLFVLCVRQRSIVAVMVLRCSCCLIAINRSLVCAVPSLLLPSLKRFWP